MGKKKGDKDQDKTTEGESSGVQAQHDVEFEVLDLDWSTVRHALPKHPSKKETDRALQKNAGISKQRTSEQPIKRLKRGVDSAPRFIAEYEQMGGVLVGYPKTGDPNQSRTFGFPLDLLIRLQQNKSVHIFIIAGLEPAEQRSVIQSIQACAASKNLPFDPTMVHWVNWDSDTYWTRDFGPWWIELDNKVCVSKHTYTTLGGGVTGLFRPNDDYAGVAMLVQYLGKEEAMERLFDLGLNHVGGNIMTDGQGGAISTDLVYAQNPVPGNNSGAANKQRIDSIFKSFLGVDRYLTYPDPTLDYIQHIDCWGKFLPPADGSDQPQVLLDQFVAGDKQQEQNKNLDQIARDLVENGYKVVRVASTPDTAYSNSLLLNKTAFVPVTSSALSSLDKQALTVYQNALPKGWKVVGVPGFPDPSDPRRWLSTDALHCRTMGIPKQLTDEFLHSSGVHRGPLPQNKLLILFGKDHPGQDAGFKADVDNLTARFSSVASIDTLCVDDITVSQLESQIKSYKNAGVNNLVVYYTGHGFNNPEDGSPYPSTVLKNNVPLCMETVSQWCSGYNLSVVGSDCCDVRPERRFVESRLLFRATFNLASAFVGKGHLLFSATLPGQYSLGGPPEGGAFTHTFLNTFDGKWIPSLVKTKKYFAKLGDPNVNQTPVWQGDLVQ